MVKEKEDLEEIEDKMIRGVIWEEQLKEQLKEKQPVRSLDK